MNSSELFKLALGLIGGLALFLYGMNQMGEGLAKTSGGKLEGILERLTSTPIKGVLLGAAVTGIIQSSSATTVMVVGFVNSGIMKLSQTVGIIMGANIGTTVTAWLLSLAGIESSNVFLNLLKPSNFSPFLAMLGVVLIMFTKSEKKHNIGTILLGFAVLMIGMDMMSSAVQPLKEVPEFTNALTMFSNPILGMLAGTILTGIIQSSSASVGILQALCMTGTVSYGTAIPIIMGQNIGTCVTALLSSIGTAKNAKRAAFIHLYFNMIGTVVFMITFYSINAFISFDFLADTVGPAQIAIIHSVFNICTTLLLLPFGKYLVKLATFTVKGGKEEPQEDAELKVLDPRFLDTPAIAMEHCKQLTDKMALMSQETLDRAMALIWNYDGEEARQIADIEKRIDRYEDELGTYLVKLSSRTLSTKDSQTLSELLHCIGDFERISDHAVNIVDASREMYTKQMKFSDEALEEFKVFSEAVKEIVDTSVKVFMEDDEELAKTVEPLEDVIDKINREVKKRHISRLRSGKCTTEMGVILTSISTDFERVADHCSNLSVCIIQLKENTFDTHEYLETLDKGENTEFRKAYEKYKIKYKLPVLEG